MENQNLTSQNKFIAVLKHLKIYQPEEKYKVICPFHADVNASMLIDISNERFYCFGCAASGSSYELVKNAYKGLKPLKLQFKLQEILKGIKPADLEVFSKVATPKNINLARDFYFNLPQTNWLKLTDDDDVEVKQYLKKRGFKPKMLNEIGAKISFNKFYPVVFPMYDNGIFRGHVSRTTMKEIEEKRKYLYNKGFSRKSTLVGEYREEVVVLVEGFMDMLKAKQLGVKNVVAILGWKITSQQIEKLKKRGVKKIICALDNDECGRKGNQYLKSLELFEVHRLVYPKRIKDFGDVTKESFPSIQKQIQKHGGK